MAEKRKPNEEMMKALLPEVVPVGEPVSIPLEDLPEDLIGPQPSAALIASVKRFGVLVPITVIQLAERKKKTDMIWRVVDGRRRVKAAREAGLQSIRAEAYSRGLSGSVMTLSLNGLRSDNTACELEAIVVLLQKGAGMAEIAEATGLSKATVEKRLRLQNLVPEIRQALSEGKVSPTVAEEAAKLPIDQQGRLVEIMVEFGRFTGEDVRALKSARAATAVEQFLPTFGTALGWKGVVIERLEETLRIIPEASEYNALLADVRVDLKHAIHKLQAYQEEVSMEGAASAVSNPPTVKED